jgi:hypothetical protein
MNVSRGQAAPRKKVVIRRSKSLEFLEGLKNHGPEPELQIGARTVDFTVAFNWYSYMCTDTDARSFLNEYLKTCGREEDVRRLQRVPDVKLPNTAAWIARMLVKYPHLVPASFKDTFENGLAKAFTYASEEPTDEDGPKKPSVRDRMRDKASEIAAEIDGLIDDEAYDTNVFDWLKERGVASTYVPALIRKYQPLLEETVGALRGGSKDIKEAYRGIPKKETHALAEFLIGMIKDMKRYGEANRTVRKARAPRVVSVEKKLKNLKYQPESSEYKAASVNPATIIGAQELWTFDTKYGTLTRLRAGNRSGLDVKGTTIVGYDANTSVSKATGRKSQQLVENVLSSSKRGLDKIIGDLKDKPFLQERINDHILLLRAG